MEYEKKQKEIEYWFWWGCQPSGKRFPKWTETIESGNISKSNSEKIFSTIISENDVLTLWFWVPPSSIADKNEFN